jgi:hypothetical protein
MLKKARNRCHATPMLGVRPMVIAHDIEMTILIVATRKIRFSSEPSDSPPNADTSG